MLSLVVGRKKENGGAHCHLALMGLWLHYHIVDYNSCCSCCSNVKEREEGGGAPFSSFLGVCVLFFWWCFRVAMARVEKEEEKGKEARKRRKGGEEKKEKKTSWGGGSGENQTLATIIGSLSFLSNLQGLSMNGGSCALGEDWDKKGTSGGSNPNLPFYFSFFSKFPKLGRRLGTNPNLPTVFLNFFVHPFEIFHPNFG